MDASRRKARPVNTRATSSSGAAQSRYAVRMIARISSWLWCWCMSVRRLVEDPRGVLNRLNDDVAAAAAAAAAAPPSFDRRHRRPHCASPP